MPPPARHSGIRSRFRAHIPPSGSGEPAVRARAPYSGFPTGFRPNSGFRLGSGPPQGAGVAPPRGRSAGRPTMDAPGATRIPALRSPLAAERRKHQRPCGDPLPGTRRGVFTEKITDAGRVLAVTRGLHHHRNPLTLSPRRSPTPDASWRSSAAFTTIATCSPARGSLPALGVHPGADHLRAARHRLRPRPAQPGRHRPGGEVPPPPPTWMRHAMTSWPSPPSSRDLATRVWSSNPPERLNKEIRRLAMWPAYSGPGCHRPPRRCRSCRAERPARCLALTVSASPAGR